MTGKTHGNTDDPHCPKIEHTVGTLIDALQKLDRAIPVKIWTEDEGGVALPRIMIEDCGTFVLLDADF